MSVGTYVILSKAVAIAGFCYLVTIDHPGWGLLCLLLAAGVDKAEDLK
jgi:hypothetical protein